jgi:hypothetical protein
MFYVTDYITKFDFKTHQVLSLLSKAADYTSKNKPDGTLHQGMTTSLILFLFGLILTYFDFLTTFTQCKDNVKLGAVTAKELWVRKLHK